MVKKNKEGKIDVELLEVQRPLSLNVIKAYDHKIAERELRKIFIQLQDNIFMQTAYQEYLKYKINDELEFIVIEDPDYKVPYLHEYKSNIKNDFPLKRFSKHDYEESINLCEFLLKRVKESFDNLDEVERFVIKNFEYDKPPEYKDESFILDSHIYKDKYYISKKSAYIKMALQLGLMEEIKGDALIVGELKKYLSDRIITIE